jgi:DsbC/DsbD-like thiol-disulfide interchange protein
MSRSIALAVALALPVVPATARADMLQPEDIVTAELIPGWTTADGRQMAGLRLRLAPGWKTYWRAPGEAGIPPHFDWAGSENLAGVALHWPSPEVFDQNGMTSIGYHDVVVIPLELAPTLPGQPLRIETDVEIGVCQDICVPVTVHLAAELPVDAARRDPAIVAALIDRPLTAAEAGVSDISCAMVPSGDQMMVEVALSMPGLPGDSMAVVETADPTLWIGAGAASVAGDRLVMQAPVAARDGGAVILDRSLLRVTLLGSGIAVDLPGCRVD